MSKPKNQHWVPQFYLRYFATPESHTSDEPKVWIFSKNELDGDEAITNIKNICAKRFLYSPKTKTGQRSWDLETKLEGLESLLSIVWEPLAEDFIDLGDSATRKALSLFIAVLHLRHPNSLKEAGEIHRQLVEFYDKQPKHPDGTPDIDSIESNGKVYDVDLSDWNEYKGWEADDHQAFFVDQVETQATIIAEMLMKKRWSIVYTEANQFITSDNPVYIGHPEKEVFGFGTEGTIIHFPLSQKRILVMDDLHDEPANQYYPLNSEALGAFNYGIWNQGSRFLISGRPIPEVLNEINTWAESYHENNV